MKTAGGQDPDIGQDVDLPIDDIDDEPIILDVKEGYTSLPCSVYIYI